MKFANNYIFSILIILGVISIITSCDKDEFTPFYSSAPGLEWETRSIGFTNNLNDISFSGNQYIAVGDSSIFYSINGFDWNISYANAPGELFRAHWIGDKYVVVGNGCILVSSNGKDWTLTTVEGSINDVCSINNNIVAVGDSGRSLISSDGIIWNAGNHGFTSFAIVAIEGNQNGDYIVGGPWVRFRYSENGIDWNYNDPIYTNLNDSNYIRSMVSFNNQIVAVGDSGKSYGLHHLFKAEDIEYSDLNKIVTGHDRIVAVGHDGLIIMSNPITNNAIEIISSKTNLDLNGVTATKLGFIVVGDSGIIISSPINKD